MSNFSFIKLQTRGTGPFTGEGVNILDLFPDLVKVFTEAHLVYFISTVSASGERQSSNTCFPNSVESQPDNVRPLTVEGRERNQTLVFSAIDYKNRNDQ